MALACTSDSLEPQHCRCLGGGETVGWRREQVGCPGHHSPLVMAKSCWWAGQALDGGGAELAQGVGVRTWHQGSCSVRKVCAG